MSEPLLPPDLPDDRDSALAGEYVLRLLGPELLPGGPPEDSRGLEIDPVAARRLAEFYAFSADVLRHLRAGMDPGEGASEIILWPEHFDIALEAGPEEAGLRDNYGASPGDEQHAETYLYVGPWTAEPQGGLWNASAFNGAEIGYADLADGGDGRCRAGHGGR